MKKRILAPSFKVWLEKESLHVLGKGGASLLKAVSELGSITKAAKKIGVSYKYAWDRLADIEKVLGEPVLQTSRGGKTGGGWAKLTDVGKEILKDYERVEKYINRVLEDEESWEMIGLKISARNRLNGIVEDINKGEVTSKVKIKINVPAIVSAVITTEAVEDLNIKPGDKVDAVIKATEVMVAKD
ncbi:TOBE domain-containing protein [[Eubacterium] cellulosolvens]